VKVYTKPLDAYQRTSVVGARAARSSDRSTVDGPSTTAAEVTISPEARALMSRTAETPGVVDRAKVDALKASIANGTFQVNPMVVAKRLLQGDF